MTSITSQNEAARAAAPQAWDVTEHGISQITHAEAAEATQENDVWMIGHEEESWVIMTHEDGTAQMIVWGTHRHVMTILLDGVWQAAQKNES